MWSIHDMKTCSCTPFSASPKAKPQVGEIENL